MDLQDHPCPQVLLIHPPREVDHRDLDEVRGAALNRRVHRGPLRELAHTGVLTVDLRKIPATASQGRDEAVLPGLSDGLLHVSRHAGIRGEIAVYELLCLEGRDAQLPGQPVSAHAVHHPVVDRLRLTAHILVHDFRKHPEQKRRGSSVHVLIRGERRG